MTFYLRLPSVPSGPARIVQIVNNNSGSSLTAGNFGFSSGKLQLRNGTTTIGTTATALQANVTYRIGLHQKQGTGANAVLEAYIAQGDTAFTTPFAQSSTQSIITPIKEVVFGATNSTAVDAIFDGIALDTAAFAPLADGTTPTNTPTNTPTATNTPTVTPAGLTATPTNIPLPTANPTATPPSGTRLRLVTFENASLTDAVTGLSSTTGTVSRDTSAPLKGTASFQVPNSTGFGRITLGSQTEVFISFYLRLASVPTGPVRILNISNTSGTVGNLAFSSGKLQLRTGTTTIGTTASALQANTTYRIAIHQKSGTGSNAVLEAFIVDTTGGDIAFGTPFAQQTNDTFTTVTDNVQVGSTNNTALDARFDNIDSTPARCLAPRPRSTGR